MMTLEVPGVLGSPLNTASPEPARAALLCAGQSQTLALGGAGGGAKNEAT
jgi:hypothetical protein